MVRHQQKDDAWWCLPGGGIEAGETPEAAAVRELSEECRVAGKVIRETSVITFSPGDQHFTYWINIGSQVPQQGYDPELTTKQTIVDMAWIGLDELAERDRVYLWTAGLLSLPEFSEEVFRWPKDPSDPSVGR